MGVPSFFRWIHDKFPRCLVPFVELRACAGAGASSSELLREPNPNGIEFDNLFIDFNQVVHNATHPTDRPVPTTRRAMFEEIFRVVDRLVCAVRPRRLLVLAIDGVAPRAKMNQQRARRFLAVQEREHERTQQAHRNAAYGLSAPESHFDHNAITPGSEFMQQVGEGLRHYCASKVARDEAWRGLAVVLSDASVPGEGEHKIMEMIRAQRTQPGYDADSVHCVYGLDADLIMLSLATHEPRLYVLREEVLVGRQRFTKVCRGERVVGVWCTQLVQRRV